MSTCDEGGGAFPLGAFDGAEWQELATPAAGLTPGGVGAIGVGNVALGRDALWVAGIIAQAGAGDAAVSSVASRGFVGSADPLKSLASLPPPRGGAGL